MPQETHSQFGVGLADFEDKGLAIRVGVLTHDRLFPAHPGLRKKDRQHCARRLVLDRLHSLASVLLTSKIKGLPSALACSLTTVSFQPIRVFAKKIDSIARDDSFLIGCVPAGGVIPKIFATIKLPIRACSEAAPTEISRGKCFFSVPSSNGLPVCGFTTNWQIIACGTPKPTRS